MALRYDSGNGVQQNPVESVKWLRKAAEQDFVKAQYNLGCMYNLGESVSQDHAEAVKWLRKAAEQGYASAQKNLGANYGNGQGVPQSDVEAFVWSSIAAASGDEGAINNRDLAASRLSAEELEMAQKRATELNTEIQQRIADT
jgi:TPR repeat protein